MTRLLTARAGLLATLLLPGLAAAAGLNDTGVTLCGNLNQSGQGCPQTSFPRQDAETGRDAQAGLLKAGGGSAGFDFTKLGNDCVRDNVTGLIWEVKTDDGGLRDKDWTYTWCNNNASTNGGNAGTCDTGAGVGSDNCKDPTRCDTEKYVQDVNALNPPLCGYNTGWRMPTIEELRSIVDYSRQNPAIENAYFPRTISNWFWSASPYAPSADYAWDVNFSYGYDNAGDKGNAIAVRLVRGGQ